MVVFLGSGKFYLTYFGVLFWNFKIHQAFLKRCSQKHCTWNNVSAYILHSWRFFLCGLFFYVSTLKTLPTSCLSICELLEKIKVLLSPQLFHQYQQDVYKPRFMLGIPRREQRLTVLSNKQSQQHFSAMENWLKSYGQAVIGRKTQQGFPLLIDRQEADCRTLSGFLTLFYAQ